MKPALFAKSSTNEPKDFSASLNVTWKAFALSSASEPSSRSLTPAAAAPAVRTKAPFEATFIPVPRPFIPLEAMSPTPLSLFS